MKITDLKCMVLDDLRALLVRVDTDEGISGLAQIEASKYAYLKPHVLFYKRLSSNRIPPTWRG